MIYNSIQSATNMTVSPVKAWDESIEDYLAIEQIYNKIFHIFKQNGATIIQPQGLLYDSKHMEEFLSILKDKLPDGESVSSMMDKLTKVLDLAETHKEYVSAVLDTAKKVQDTTEKVVNAVETTSVLVKSVGVGALAFYSIRFMIQPTKMKALAILLLGALLYGLGIVDDFISIIKSVLTDCLPPLFKILSNDSVDINMESLPDSNIINIVTQSSNLSEMSYDGVIIGFLTYMGIKTKLSLSEMKKDNTFRTMSDLLRLRSSLPEFLDAIFGYAKNLYNDHLADFLKLNRLNVTSFSDPYLQSFEDDVMQIKEDLASGSFPMSIDNFAKIKFMHEKSKELYKGIANTREKASVRQLFNKNIDILAKIRQQFENSNVHLNGFRVEPVGVLLRGGPGTHKSTVMSHLASACAAAVLSDKDFESYKKCPQNFEHNRQHENVYMDGYTPQTITIMIDDLGQTKDVPGNPDTEWMNVVRFVNSFEAMGHMANMEQKGVMRIRPKFVMATTNLIRMASNSINSIDAVVRRFPVSLVCVPKGCYTTEESEGIYDRRFDYSKLPTVTSEDGTITSDIRPEHFMFYKCDANGNVMGHPLDFTDVMDWIIKEHKLRVTWHSTHVKNFEEVSSFYRDRYFSASNEPQSGIPYDMAFDDSVSGSSEISSIDSESSGTPWYDKFRGERNNHIVSLLEKHADAYPNNYGNHPEFKRLYKEHQDYYNGTDERDKKVELLKKYYTPSCETFKKYYEKQFRDNKLNIFQTPREIIEFQKWNADWEWLYKDIPAEKLNCLLNCSIDWAHLDLDYQIKLLYKINCHLLQNFLITGIEPCAEHKVDLPVWARDYARGDTSMFTRVQIQFNEYMEKFIGWSFNTLGSLTEFLGSKVSSFMDLISKLDSKTINIVLMFTGFTGLMIFGMGMITNDKTIEKKIPVMEEEFKKLYIPTQSMPYDVYKSGKTNKNKTVSQMRQTIKNQSSKPEINVQGLDSAGFDIIESVTTKNLIRCFVYPTSDCDNPNFMGYGILLKKNKILVPVHFFERLYRGVESDVRRLEHTVRLLPVSDEPNVLWVGECSVKDFLSNGHDEGLEETHTMIIDIPTKDCRNIINTFFVTEAQAANMSKMFQVSIAIPHRKTLVHSSAYKTVVPISDGDIKYNVTKGMRYFVDTYSGDCGAPVYIRNAKLQAHRIMGMHIAGSTKSTDEMAFAALLTKESIIKCMNQFKDDSFNVKTILPEDVKEIELQSDSPFLADRFSLLCEVSQYHSPYGFSDIKKSRLQKPIGPFESNMRVAMLLPRNGIDPYKNALKNYCSNEALVDKELLEFCKNDFMDVLFDPSWNNKDVLTLEQALWGDSELEFCDAMKSSTSAGYPMKYDIYNRKKVLFDPKFSRDSTNPAYEETLDKVNEIIENARNGIRMLHVFTDCLKSERRKVQKVLEGLSRQFNGAPFDYFTVVRMYFGAFAMFIHTNSGKNSMVTSINPFSGSWNNIAQDLSKFSTDPDPLVCDGDFAHFDGSLLTEFADAILDIINKWYNDGNHEIRKILWMEVTNSRHISGNIIYEWFASLISGHPLTLIINCMNNLLLHRYGFYQRHSRLVKFHKEVAIFVTGDDVIMSVSDKYKQSFNGIVVQEMMAKIGYTYTSATKDDEVVDFKPLSQAQFLKRSFRMEPLLGQYIGPLDLKTVVEIPLWTKKHDSLAITVSNITEFFDELSLHDQSVWDTWAEKYKHAIHTLFPEFYDNHLLNCNRVQRLGYKFDTELSPFVDLTKKDNFSKYGFGVNPKYTVAGGYSDEY